MEICNICGRPAEAKHHLIFGRGLRDLADEDELFIHICNSCHNMGSILSRIHDNPMAEKLSKMLGQAIYEQKYSREQFVKRYGRSYL